MKQCRAGLQNILQYIKNDLDSKVDNLHCTDDGEPAVRSPMVPPIADNMSTNLAALSLVILLIVGVSKKILIYLNLFFHSQKYIN